MNLRHLIYILLTSLLLCSCHSHRKAVRADNASGRDINIEKIDRSTLETGLNLKGDANNKVTKALIEEAYTWLGTPYKYGGETKDGADCSGFVMVVFRDVLEINLPRVSREQGEYCKRINKGDLFPGDLVFFHTGSSDKVNHVGLYIGDGKMIHASSSKGIMISELSQKYYIDHYNYSGRVEEYFKMIKKK